MQLSIFFLGVENMDGNKKGVKEPIGTYEWKKELKRRLDIEKARKELPVYYYRIYRRTVFKLPVTNGWQNTLPVRYENIKPYPWEIWLMWSLRERWDTLLAGVVLDRDMEALDILQTELEVAFEWDTYAIGTDAYLGTAHFAMCVYRYLESGFFLA